MSVRNALLALVAQQPAGVYRLKQMFEEQTCGAWPLNIGQVYQTMQRLERDGQVVSHAETNAGRDSEVFELTDAGREVLNAWWSTPVPREHPDRDELVMKLAVAAADPTVDVEAMIQTQRRSTLGSLRDVTRLKASADEGELAWKLILERHIFDLEAELNWLDHIESGAVSEAARRAAFAAAKGRSMSWARRTRIVPIDGASAAKVVSRLPQTSKTSPRAASPHPGARTSAVALEGSHTSPTETASMRARALRVAENPDEAGAGSLCRTMRAWMGPESSRAGSAS